MKKLLGPFLFLVCLTAYSQDVEKIDMDLDKEKLNAGELQTFEFDYITSGQGKKKGVIGVLLIDAPPAEVWKLIEDWDSMPKYVPGLTHHKTRVALKSSKDGKPLETLIEAKLKTAGVLNILYTLKVKFDREKLKQEWSFVTDKQIEEFNRDKHLDLKKSSFGIKNISGFEYLETHSGGLKTVYYYAPVVEISIPLPGFIEKAITGKSLSDFMLAVKRKAEARPAER